MTLQPAAAQPTAAPPAVKICCIASIDEARLAIAHGARALGLVSAMPSGPGVIDEGLIADIAAEVAEQAPGIDTYLLTSRQRADDILAQHRRCRTTTLQLVDAVPPDDLAALRRALPAVRLVQVIHVTGPASMDEAAAVAPLVDAVLLDSGNPALQVKQLGGTGRTHDWGLSRRIREQVRAAGRPLILAGGLHAGNARDAVAAVQPDMLDVCSGVRRDGRLDAARLAALMQALGPAR